MAGLFSRATSALGGLFRSPRDDTPSDRYTPQSPDAVDNKQAAVGHDDRPAPHVLTFGQLLNTIWKTYSYRYDEALRNNPADALAMRRDCYFRSLLQERLLPTARRKWQLEVDNPQDPNQKLVRDGLTASVRGITRFARFRRYLLEAEWYGRYGSQGTWEQDPRVKDQATGVPLYVFKRHQPVNGDKIQHQWDGTPAIMVNRAMGNWPKDSIILGNRATLLRLDRPEWRRQFVIHTYDVEDADYYEGDMAGAVNGIGLRSHIYWSWWMREEMLGWAVDFMQKVGTLGLLIFWYEQGNEQARKQAETNAKEANNRAAFVMPRPGGKTDMPPGGVEQIAPQTGGIEALQDMIANYWERHQERLFVGQSMSGGADNESGLGGTGRADFAKDTKYQILAYSAENLDETLTNDLVRVAQELNYPWADFPVRFKSMVPDPDMADKLDKLTKVWDRLKVKEEEAYEVTGFTVPEEGDVTIGGVPEVMPGVPGAPGQEPGANGKPLGGLLGDPAPLGGLLGRGANANGNGKPLGGLLGSGHAEQPETYKAQHAPKGGVTVAGKDFRGGEFIPAEVMAKATPAERAKIETGSGAGAGAGKAPKPSHGRAVELAKAKIAANPKPSAEAAEAAGVRMDEVGADRYEADIRGNTTDRANSRKRLLAEFGDGKSCPCVYCGLKLVDKEGPNLVTRDKIYTARQGGRYTHSNLLPACLACNKSRSDTPIEKVKWPS